MLYGKLRQYGLDPFYIRPKKTPDALMLDYLYNYGEFSIARELEFEKHLKYLYQLKCSRYLKR